MEEKYPYLGIKQIEDKSYVVLFTTTLCSSDALHP